MIKENIESKTWEEFRETGLYLLINSILHAFGWVIVTELKDGTTIKCYPARTKYRGFPENEVSKAHEKIACYLSNNAKDFPKEIE